MDQKSAIQAVIQDMMMKPMDRLICGDVGFGKTKLHSGQVSAVSSGKQVAVLTPTTLPWNNIIKHLKIVLHLFPFKYVNYQDLEKNRKYQECSRYKKWKGRYSYWNAQINRRKY